MVVLAVLIALGIFILIFKLWQTCLKDLGISSKTATIVGAIVVILLIVTSYLR